MDQRLLAALAPRADLEYTVTVVQQPIRARMCGFGDKDRRPISPPLIVQLTAVDQSTGLQVPVDDLDTTFLILASDLRDSDTLGDANLILPPGSSGRISSSSAMRTPSSSCASSQHSSAASRSCSPSSPPFEYPSPQDSQTSPKGTPKGALGPLPEEEEEDDNRTPQPSGMTRLLSSAPSVSPPPPASGLKRPSPGAEPPMSLDFPDAPSQPPPAKRLRTGESRPLPLPNSPTVPLTPPSSTVACSHDTDSHDPSCASTAAALPPASAPAPPSNSSFIPYARARPSYTEHRSMTSSASNDGPSAPDADVEGTEVSTALVPNLIGTLHTNAYKLKDLDGERGVYFVLPDLSVRNEGQFRLRLRLLSIGFGGARSEAGLNVVASACTDPFRVCSAKKFEGMLDPTPLSQCFAKQGVRIPTRKVARAKGKKEAAVKHEESHQEESVAG
ncbi:velvet factor family protein [Rhodotorula paludigena]|uniref:velvet factor family protein n=1 Tax=Rhodotorula paludigena TaxID=86838 RepID=UPI003176136D